MHGPTLSSTRPPDRQSPADYPIRRFACGHGPTRQGGRPTLEAATAKAETY